MSTYTGDLQVSLSAIIVGALISIALMALFTLLGLSIGVASLDGANQVLGVGAAIYVVVKQLVSLVAGGFAASRLLDTYDTPAAGMAGVSVWALATIVLAVGGIGTGASAINSTANLAGQVSKGAAGAVQAIAPDDLQLPDISDLANDISLSNLPPELQQALEEAEITPSALRAELGEAFRNVISEQELSRARSIVTSTASDVITQPSSFAEEVNAAIDELVGGENAVLSEEDLTQATNTLQRRLGITDAQAQELVASVRSQYDSAIETLRQSVNDMQQNLVSAAETAQSAVASASLWLFIASLLGLAAAAGGGVLGRRT